MPPAPFSRSKGGRIPLWYVDCNPVAVIRVVRLYHRRNLRRGAGKKGLPHGGPRRFGRAGKGKKGLDIAHGRCYGFPTVLYSVMKEVVSRAEVQVRRPSEMQERFPCRRRTGGERAASGDARGVDCMSRRSPCPWGSNHLNRRIE